MPAGSSLFLGIELAVDQLRASLVDETLDLVGVESVDFDTELAEYQCVFSFFLSSRKMKLTIDYQDAGRDLHDARGRLHDASGDVDKSPRWVLLAPPAFFF
jgi:hypothetical protein